MNIIIVGKCFDEAIDKMKSLDNALTKVHKYHYKNESDNYFICIIDENLDSHKPRIDKIIIVGEIDEELKIVLKAWECHVDKFKL